MTAHKKLVLQLVGAVAVAFAASMALTWLLHDRMTEKEAHKLISSTFRDVDASIRERVNQRMIRKAMMVRDRIPAMRAEPWWSDPDESSRRLRRLADELEVDEICIADSKGILTHSARREEVLQLDFCNTEGQAREFAQLLDSKTELAQPLMPNSLRGDMVKYVGVWLPEGGFVQVGGRDECVRRLSRTAVTGITHDWHVSGEDGFIVVTTAIGTIISHSDEAREGGEWHEPGEESYWQKRIIEGFPTYVVIPKKTAIVERRLLVGTSAFLNAMALIFAAFLVGIVIASYVRSQLRARRASELMMARDIQESAIPRVFPPFPDVRCVDIFADMKPAKDVGGDFYDFYFSGANKITFIIADVSDKGVPAALFMMRAKTLVKAIAQTGKPLSEVVTESNDTLCDGNGAGMFVTAWIGELDLDTGVVKYVNAGHNSPVLVGRGDGGGGDGAPQVRFVREKPSLVLGAMPGLRYQTKEIRLAPGDTLYLYTDGITEQTDQRGTLFGEERLLAAVSKAGAIDGLDGLRKLLGTVLSEVTAYGCGVEQADDCTQLAIRYNGR